MLGFFRIFAIIKAKTMIDKVGKYVFLAEPFHCDFSSSLFMGHLGNHLLNAADFHANDRDFGMNYLMPRNKTWVLSRLVIEMDVMPKAYDKFCVETWVESAMRYFTSRNFAVSTLDGLALGYGRSIWAMIDTQTRQPSDILSIHEGSIVNYIDAEKLCPIARPSRVKMGDSTQWMRTIDTQYSDVDVNGHINSVKYIEHLLDMFPMEWHKSHLLKRLDVAYVAESHAGDQLAFYREQINDNEFNFRILKQNKDNEEGVEVVRAKLIFA